MENWCQPCLPEGKSVVGKWKIDGRWFCTGHYMTWRKEHPEEKAQPIPFDVPIPVVEKEEAPEPVEATKNPEGPKKRGPYKKVGRLTALADAAQATNHKKRIGRPPGSENRPKAPRKMPPPG